jgi:hypothetical protein
LPRLGREPGVIAVRLEHQQTGQAAHPVDVRETFQGVELSLQFIVPANSHSYTACLNV